MFKRDYTKAVVWIIMGIISLCAAWGWYTLFSWLLS
jgi:hypothetical protein